MFKIGDRVRALKGDGSFVRQGDAGIVRSIHSFYLQVKWSNPQQTSNDNVWAVNSEDVELVEEKTMFNVGDRVRIKVSSGYEPEHMQHNLELANVRYVLHTGAVQIKLVGNGKLMILLPHNLEMVEAKERKNKNVKITLPNGLVLEGTIDQIQTVSAKLGYTTDLSRTHYNSSHKGWLLISEMETSHIKNALLKLYREWITKLGEDNNTSTTQACRNVKLAVHNGPDNPTFAALYTELCKRV